MPKEIMINGSLMSFITKYSYFHTGMMINGKSDYIKKHCNHSPPVFFVSECWTRIRNSPGNMTLMNSSQHRLIREIT